MFCLMHGGGGEGGRIPVQSEDNAPPEKNPRVVPLPVIPHTFPTFISETSFPEKKKNNNKGGVIFLPREMNCWRMRKSCVA